MWTEAYAAVCRQQPDVIAVFESPHGRLALLLRQSLVPLPEERACWFDATRRAARSVTRSLRSAGLVDDVTILQWRPLRQIAHIMKCWDCCFEGDSVRYAELADIVSTRPPDGGPTPPTAGVGRWYRDMTPCWMTAEPSRRRRLLLRTHRWIADYVLEPIARGGEPDPADLEDLAKALAGTVPARELDQWRPWIRLALADLRQALAWPSAQRSEAWARWLFLIPYGIPLRGDVASRGDLTRHGDREAPPRSA